jgi:hypothetical protein
LAQHVGKESAVLKVLGLLDEGRTVGKDVRLRRMTVQINEHLHSLAYLLLATFEVFNDAHELWKEVIS